jgi:hypothetical protein
MPPSAWKVNS